MQKVRAVYKNTYKFIKRKTKSVFFRISLIITIAVLIILALYTIAQVFSINVLADKQDKIALEKAYSDMKMDSRVIGHFTNNDEFYNYVYNLAKNNPGRSYRVFYDNNIAYETAFKQWDRIPYPKQTSEQSILKYKIKGSNYMVLTGEVDILNENLDVQILQTDRGIDDVLSGYFPIFISVIIVGIILSILAGILISKNILIRIKRLSKTMSEVKNSKNLKGRIKISEAKDEFDELNETFNSMMDKVEGVFDKQNQFISDASHELRTPLTAIKGHLGLIKRWGKDDKEMLEESLDICLEEIDRLNNMVNSLLVLSREDNKQIDLSDIPAIYPERVIYDLVNHYKVIDSNIIFNVDIKSNVRIKMKKDDLKQLLIIFIDNAIKYNNKDKILIDLNIEMEDGKVLLSIKDNGIGIGEEDLTKVLNRFYRVDKARTGSSKSFGIGLSIAKRIIENYKGEIKLESKINEWTKIIVMI